MRIEISIDVSAERNLIVFTAKGRGETDIYLLDLSTRIVRRLTRSSWYERNPRFLPNGKAILFEARRDASNPRDGWNLFIITLHDWKIKQLTHTRRVSDAFVSFLPNRSKLLIARTPKLRRYSMGGYVWDWNVASYYVLDLNSQRLESFPVRLSDWYIHAFSPSGEQVLAARPISGVAGWREPELWLLESRPLIQHGVAKGRKIAEGTDAVWIPSLNQIAFVAPGRSQYEREVWTIGLDGSKLVQRTKLRGYLDCLRVDTKRNYIYFLKVEDGATMLRSLWRLHLPSGHVEKVADTTLFSDPLRYSKR